MILAKAFFQGWHQNAKIDFLCAIFNTTCYWVIYFISDKQCLAMNSEMRRKSFDVTDSSWTLSPWLVRASCTRCLFGNTLFFSLWLKNAKKTWNKGVNAFVFRGIEIYFWINNLAATQNSLALCAFCSFDGVRFSSSQSQTSQAESCSLWSVPFKDYEGCFLAAYFKNTHSSTDCLPLMLNCWALWPNTLKHIPSCQSFLVILTVPR